MSASRTAQTLYTLALADGTRWELAAGDDKAAAIVTLLGQAMQLDGVSDAGPPNADGPTYRLVVEVDAHTSVADVYIPLASGRGGCVVCVLSPCEDWGGPFINLMRLSLIMARQTQARGGVLIHGALAERNGLGVILSAPGGTGKSTASRRLALPWHSLCDDTTLVVRAAQGDYRAHPWPTWSRFLGSGPGGSWDVQRSVPLRELFILNQAAEDQAERVGPGQAVSLLMEGVGQASMFMQLGLTREALRVLYQERFDNLTALAHLVPVSMLRLSLGGRFWCEMERMLEADYGGPAPAAMGMTVRDRRHRSSILASA